MSIEMMRMKMNIEDTHEVLMGTTKKGKIKDFSFFSYLDLKNLSNSLKILVLSSNKI
jgi:hypothetical protein